MSIDLGLRRPAFAAARASSRVGSVWRKEGGVAGQAGGEVVVVGDERQDQGKAPDSKAGACWSDLSSSFQDRHFGLVFHPLFWPCLFSCLKRLAGRRVNRVGLHHDDQHAATTRFACSRTVPMGSQSTHRQSERFQSIRECGPEPQTIASSRRHLARAPIDEQMAAAALRQPLPRKRSLTLAEQRRKLRHVRRAGLPEQ